MCHARFTQELQGFTMASTRERFLSVVTAKNFEDAELIAMVAAKIGA